MVPTPTLKFLKFNRLLMHIMEILYHYIGDKGMNPKCFRCMPGQLVDDVADVAADENLTVANLYEGETSNPQTRTVPVPFRAFYWHISYKFGSSVALFQIYALLCQVTINKTQVNKIDTRHF
jgi:hypothetical protein